MGQMNGGAMATWRVTQARELRAQEIMKAQGCSWREAYVMACDEAHQVLRKPDTQPG